MLGISFSECVLIFIVALTVFGPKQLPKVATRFGLFVYAIKSYITGVRDEFYYKSGVYTVTNTKSDLIAAYNNVRQNICSNVGDFYNMASFIEDLHQPELDFDCQPELFDELRNR